MSDWVPQFVDNKGVKLAVYTAGDQKNPPILLVHGWPELAYSWSPIMPALAAAGYHVIAPDLRGFGNSDCPPDIADYRIDKLMSDIEAVLDHYGHRSAIFCGHDWGGIIVWHAARLLEARASHIISICTPHIRRAPIDPVQIFKKRSGDGHYFVHFNERYGEADALFDSNPDAFFRMMIRTVPKGTVVTPDFMHTPRKFQEFLEAGAPALKGQILADEQRAVFVDGYKRAGFRGGLNLYRNTKPNWEFMEGQPETITQPTLMISPEDDLILPPSLTDPMVDMVPDLTRVIIPNCGHWAMWEQPEAVGGEILEWVTKLRTA